MNTKAQRKTTTTTYPATTRTRRSRERGVRPRKSRAPLEYAAPGDAFFIPSTVGTAIGVSLRNAVTLTGGRTASHSRAATSTGQSCTLKRMHRLGSRDNLGDTPTWPGAEAELPGIFGITGRMPTWTAVTITAAAELAEPLESFLLDRGAPGLQTEELGGAVRITAHFAAAAPLAELDVFVAALRELVPGAAPPAIAVDTVADQGWAENWKAHFPPLLIGERLYIHPPWIDAVPAGRIAIVLDPGMAFGTGHHASTRGCLILMERALRAVPRARVLDLGTGSGILAIAAAKLGAAEVWAVDIDSAACAVAIENAAVNRVAERIRITAELTAVPGTFDIIVANLLAGLLVDCAADIAGRLRPGGVAIGAGLLCEETAAVRDAWRAAHLADDGELADEGWMAVAARRAA